MTIFKTNKSQKLLNLLGWMGFVLIYFPVKGLGDDIYDLITDQFYKNKGCSIKLLHDLRNEVFSNEVIPLRYQQYLILSEVNYQHYIMNIYFLNWFFKEDETACFMTRDEFAILLEDFIEEDLSKEEFSQILRENFPSFEEIETIRKLYRSLTKLRKKSV